MMKDNFSEKYYQLGEELENKFENQDNLLYHQQTLEVFYEDALREIKILKQKNKNIQMKISLMKDQIDSLAVAIDLKKEEDEIEIDIQDCFEENEEKTEDELEFEEVMQFLSKESEEVVSLDTASDYIVMLKSEIVSISSEIKRLESISRINIQRQHFLEKRLNKIDRVFRKIECAFRENKAQATITALKAPVIVMQTMDSNYNSLSSDSKKEDKPKTKSKSIFSKILSKKSSKDE